MLGRLLAVSVTALIQRVSVHQRLDFIIVIWHKIDRPCALAQVAHSVEGATIIDGSERARMEEGANTPPSQSTPLPSHVSSTAHAGFQARFGQCPVPRGCRSTAP